ncbi:MAG: 50S ribosomal protein L11 methyltransferase [Oscillospiraceae bacterium]|jgi:ribosomal protein L11 methyltransferase|nr:50S ribosomal protein L11 methyltransferase [Oscillospiraceae bacterium]
MPDWNEIVVHIDASDAEAAQAISFMAAPYGVYVEDYTDLEQSALEIARVDLIDGALLAKDRGRVVIHVYLSPQDHPNEAAAWIAGRLAAEGVAHEVGIQTCRSEDWENNWKAYFHPLPVGERLLIQPAWEPPVDPGGRAVLLLEPGLAFGSGSHATTRLCMEALERAVTPGCAVLDIGCGSGILSIAAMLLGAGRALGVDIDPMAVECARENAARNALACEFARGDLAACVTGAFDVVVSNIVADAIVSLAGQIQRHLKPGGVWVSAGIIDTRAGDVLEALEGNGWRVLERREEEGWVCLAAGR